MAYMSDAVLVALIAAVPPTVVSVVAVVVAMINTRKIEIIHKATNSMKDELVKVTQSDSFQKGHAAGVADEKAS